MHDLELVARLRAAGCVYAEDEALVLREAASGDAELDALAARRVAGEPLEVVVGWAEFCGLRVSVGSGVFVPRRRSEWTVEVALRVLGGCGGAASPVVVDLCCGVGAIALALATVRPGIELHAADVSPVAGEWARRNLAGAGAVHVGDLYSALPESLRGRVDLIVANAPYVPTGELGLLPAEARDHEPVETLDGGADGVDLHRRIALGAPEWLEPDGVLVIETSLAQAPLTATAMSAAGLVPRVEHDPDREATAVVGRRQS